MKRSPSLFPALFALLLASCGSSTDTKSIEKQIRAFVADVERFVEDGDVDSLTDAISEKYHDERGQTKRNVAALAHYYTTSRKSVHIISKIRELVLTDSTHAQLEVLAGFSGRPVDDMSNLGGVGAEIMTFDVRLEKEGREWKIAAAEWGRVRPVEFFPSLGR